jgi:hypothetical protein
LKPKTIASVLAIPIFMTGCAQTNLSDKWNTREAYSFESDNFAILELRAMDKFRNSDQMTVSIQTRESCEENPRIRKVIHLESEYDWLLRDKSTYSKTAKIEGDTVHLLRLWATSVAPYFMPECTNTGAWKVESGKHYILEVKNWSSGGKDGTEAGGFGCEWSLVDKADSTPIAQSENANYPTCDEQT